MAFRALLYSKNPETNAALTSACQNAGINLEICDDIFSALLKGTREPFACVLADWSQQPEAGFLFKRAREWARNVNTAAIAIVDREPAEAEKRAQRLDFLIYRPVAVEEAQDVLVKATEKARAAGAKDVAEPEETAEQPALEMPNATAGTFCEQSPQHQNDAQHSQCDSQHWQSDESSSDEAIAPYEIAPAEDGGSEQIEEGEEESPAPRRAFPVRQYAAAALGIAAALCLWNARNSFLYLARTPENGITVLKEAISAPFSITPTNATPAGAADSVAPQEAYSGQSVGGSDTSNAKVGVIEAETELSGTRVPLRKAADLPLPSPVYRPEPAHEKTTVIPDSLRTSAPITRPMVVTGSSPQVVAVSTPPVPLTSTQFTEPVLVNEDVARSLLVHSVTPAYPPEATAQKLHGPVVLQTTIGSDGRVEDVKIVRGPFLLAQAAIAAVKQWQFQPYVLNGRPTEMQTAITVNF